MKNFIQAGENLTLPAPYTVQSGEAALIGSIFGVASTDAAITEETAFVTTGVFSLPKEAVDDVSIGEALYWDDSNRNVTVVDTGFRVGVAVSNAAGGVSSVSVRLNGSF